MDKKKFLSKKIIIPVVAVLVVGILVACVAVGYNNGMLGSLFNPTSGPTVAPTAAPTDAPTEPPTEAPTLPQAEVEALAQKLIAETDFLAAGYDYDKAINMLSTFEHASRVPAVAEKIAQYQAAKAKCSRYEKMNTITHIFFHSLIVDEQRAFGPGSYQRTGYNQWMTTVEEFKSILQSMYDRGFVLVTPYQVAYEVTDENGNAKFVEGDIYLPAGKKPFIMSQDDLNYYGYMIADSSAGVNSTPVFASKKGDGFAHKIVIGEDGKPTCQYMDAQGNILVGEYDLVPILEAFIQEHPDFAYQGARAVLGVTGYEGVFGYRTKPSYANNMSAEAYAKEVEDAKAVAQCLKDNGWIIASHSYGHPPYGERTAEKIQIDNDKFVNTVVPIVGECDIIIYPHGSDVAGSEHYTMENERFKVLYDAGYRYFFNVNSSDYWVQMGDDYYRGGRRNVDGYRMWYHPNKLDDLMGTKVITYTTKDEEGNTITVERTVSEFFSENRPKPVPQV